MRLEVRGIRQADTSATQRKQIAPNAAKARWAKQKRKRKGYPPVTYAWPIDALMSIPSSYLPTCLFLRANQQRPAARGRSRVPGLEVGRVLIVGG
jgi:hypothetical protein